MSGIGGLLSTWEGSPVALAIGVLLGVFVGWLAGRWYAAAYSATTGRPRAPAAEPLGQLARARSPVDLLPVLAAARSSLAAEGPGTAAARLDRRLARLERRAAAAAGHRWLARLSMGPSERFARYAADVDRALGELDRWKQGGRP